MLLVRRCAPEGSYFADGDRASGVFGVLATGFAIFAGFVIFLAFTSYDQSRAGGRTEALSVVQQFETAQFLPAESASGSPASSSATGAPSCTRSGREMEAGTADDAINPWGIALFRTLQTVSLETPAEEAAYGKWLDQTSEREEARRDRLHGAAGIIPTSLWLVLFLIAGIVFAYMLFFADSGERASSQAMLIGSATAVVVATLLAIYALDNPYRRASGASSRSRWSVRSASSTRRADLARPTPLPCDDEGSRDDRPRRARSTVLLAVAAVATAWCSYQATRWNGEQANAASRTNAIRIEAARAQGLAEAQTQVDVATFTQWVDAYAREETELADFYFERFRAEFKPAVDAWIAARPLKNPDAPLTPFAMPQYRLAATAEAERLDAEAEASSAAIVRRNIQRASNYVLGVVLFAVSLFFAGMSTKLGSPAPEDPAGSREHPLRLHGRLDRDVSDQPGGLRMRWP